MNIVRDNCSKMNKCHVQRSGSNINMERDNSSKMNIEMSRKQIIIGY
jgi:hypothetical protein